MSGYLERTKRLWYLLRRCHDRSIVVRVVLYVIVNWFLSISIHQVIFCGRVLLVHFPVKIQKV